MSAETEEARRFTRALRELYEAAGRPPHRLLIARAKQEHPPLTLTARRLSDWFGGRHVPAAPDVVRFLVTFLQARAVGGPAREWSWWADLHRRVQRSKSLRAGRPRSAPRADSAADVVTVRQANPRLLGVQASITVAHAPAGLPAYVPRDADWSVRAAVAGNSDGTGRFVLLVGSSSVGKTRCAYEAVLSEVPDWPLAHPASAEELAGLAADVVPRTVVWLDEIQFYVGDVRTTAAIRRLIATPDVVVIGTIWASLYNAYTSVGGVASPADEPRRVLRMARVFDISAALSADEAQRARQVGRTDSRIAVALASADFPMTAVLAAGPDLVRTWENADPYVKAIITVAVDARRLGFGNPVPLGVLQVAAPGYLSAAERGRATYRWISAATGEAARPLREAVAMLSPEGDGMGAVAGYRVADYLQQHVERMRWNVVPPHEFWHAFGQTVRKPDGLANLAQAAYDRLLFDPAEELIRAAMAAGAQGAHSRYSHWLRQWGRPDEKVEASLRTAVAAGDADAWEDLASWLQDRGRSSVEVELALRSAMEAQARGAPMYATWLLERRAHLLPGLKTLGRTSATKLAQWLAKEGRPAPEIEEAWTRAAEFREQQAHYLRAAWLESSGAPEKIVEDAWSEAIEHRDPNAHLAYARWLEKIGRRDNEVERRLRAAVAAGDFFAGRYLTEFLAERERPTLEIEQAWRDATEANGISTYDELARFLIRTDGTATDIEDALRRAVEHRGLNANEQLAFWLEKQGRPADEVETALHAAIAAHELVAHTYMAEWRERQGDSWDELVQFWSAANVHVLDEYASWLERHRRPAVEIHAALTEACRRDGHMAGARLAEWLKSNGAPNDEVENAFLDGLRSASAGGPDFYARWLRAQGRTRDAENLTRWGLHLDGRIRDSPPTG